MCGRVLSTVRRPNCRTLTGRPSAIQHGEGEHEEGHDQGRDRPGRGEHAVVARSGARDRGIQIRRPAITSSRRGEVALSCRALRSFPAVVTVVGGGLVQPG